MSQAEFEKAAAMVKQITVHVLEDEQLDCYSLYKQATLWDYGVAYLPTPNLKSSAKWEAWNKCKGVAKEEAMKTYIAKAQAL